MKQFYFISGLPRSGSTLLSAILKQNPDFYADISSPLEKLSKGIIDTISSHETNFTLNKNSRKNLIYSVFNGYYDHVDKPVIFDTSREWTKKTNFLKELFPYTKILCCVRDIVSILNSFELIFSKNCFYAVKILEKNQSVFERCDELMNKQRGVISESILSLEEGFMINPEMIHFIEYQDLCKDPDNTMREIYNFLEKPYYSHDFDNLEYSNKNFDDACNLHDLHKVKRKVEYSPPKCILPKSIVKKYSQNQIEFWRNKSNKTIDTNFFKYT